MRALAELRVGDRAHVPADRSSAQPTASLAFSYESALAPSSPPRHSVPRRSRWNSRSTGPSPTRSPARLHCRLGTTRAWMVTRCAARTSRRPRPRCRANSAWCRPSRPESIPHRCAGWAPARPHGSSTGAPVPPGCDAVVRIEDTDRGEDVVRIFGTPRSGGSRQHQTAGEEIARGDQVFGAGTTVGPSCGCDGQSWPT